MEKRNTNYLTLLKNELQNRINVNSRYSIGAFARVMNIDPAAMSRILAGKQIPSKKITDKILDTIIFEGNEKKYFIESIATTQRNRKLVRKSNFFSNLTESTNSYAPIEVNNFTVIGNWYYFAIMELTYVKGFIPSPKWIANQLLITETQASLAINNLKELRLINVSSDGQINKTNKSITTTSKNKTNNELKIMQKQLLTKAIQSLEDDPIEDRSITSMTMAINETNLEKARELISDFNKRISELLEEGDQTRVYNLSIAMFPLQKERK